MHRSGGIFSRWLFSIAWESTRQSRNPRREYFYIASTCSPFLNINNKNSLPTDSAKKAN